MVKIPEISLLFCPVKHNSRPLSSVDQSKNYTGYTWKMCVTFCVCFKFLTLLVSKVSGTQKSGNWKNVKDVCLNRMIPKYWNTDAWFSLWLGLINISPSIFQEAILIIIPRYTIYAILINILYPMSLTSTPANIFYSNKQFFGFSAYSLKIILLVFWYSDRARQIKRKSVITT